MAKKTNSITNYKTFVVPTQQHQDSVWYNGLIAQYDIDKRYHTVIQAEGEIAIVDTKTGDSYENPEDLDIHNDEQLQKALEDGKIEWANNNWFEISIFDKVKKEYVTDVGCDCVLDNLNQALNPQTGCEFLNELRPTQKKAKKK